jgi:AcrR family transcriptional regulator
MSRVTPGHLAPPRDPVTSRGRRSPTGGAVTSERREEILAIAATMFAERGFATTTVREIAEAAGILSGSLYHHFDSKESMVDEILAGFLEETLAAQRRAAEREQDPARVLRDLVTQSFAALGPHGDAIAIMHNELAYLSQFARFAYLRAAADEAEMLWVGVIEDARRTGVFRTDVDAALVYRFMRDAVWIAVRWYRPDGRYTAEELADTYLRMVLEGLEAPVGP